MYYDKPKDERHRVESHLEEVLPPEGDELTGIRLFRRTGAKPENKPYYAPNIERARILESYAERYKHPNDKRRALELAAYYRARSKQ